MENALETLASDIRQTFRASCRPVDLESIQELSCDFSGEAPCMVCPFYIQQKMRTHQYGYDEAARWDGNYTYYCPGGLVFCAIIGETGSRGGLIVGPVILGDIQDMPDEGNGAFRSALRELPSFSPEAMGRLCRMAMLALRGLTGTSGTSRPPYNQAQFLNELYVIREQYPRLEQDEDYIRQAEREMSHLVQMMDKPGVQKLLNELLGRIYLQNACDLEEVKMRCVELLVLLSHTMSDSGVEVGRIFHFSTDFMYQIESFQTLDSLCAWMSEVLHNFIDAIFSLSSIKHADIVFKTMQYIRMHWQEKPTLDDIADYVYLSRAYLSTLFKQETGIGISQFITQVRVEYSKKLLSTTSLSIAAIASECCFHDQSYYTKVFQRLEGISPKKYRDRRRG